MTQHAELVQLCTDVIKSPEKALKFSKTRTPEEAIQMSMREILGFNESETITSTKFDKAMRKNGEVVFEIIEEVLTDQLVVGVDQNEFFQQFAEVRNLALGDKQSFYIEDDGVVSISQVSNGNWDIRRQKLEGGRSIQVDTQTYGAKMYADFFQLLLGRITFTDFATKVAEGFTRHLNQMVAGSFGNAVAQLPAQFQVTGALDLDKLTELYDLVEAANGSATIVGTRRALNQVFNLESADYITNSQKDDYQRTGIVGYVRGMRFVMLPQVLKENSFDFAYDDTKLMGLPASEQVKPVKIVMEGDALVREIPTNQTNEDQTVEYTMTTMYGAAVAFGGVFGYYNIV